MLHSQELDPEQKKTESYNYGVNHYRLSGEFIRSLDYENAWKCSEDAEKSLKQALQYSPDDPRILEGLIDVYHRQMFITFQLRNFAKNGNICFRKLRPTDYKLQELRKLPKTAR